jgi:ketopantoate reductase
VELDEVVGAVIELGARAGVDTPVMRSIYALAKLLDRRNRA